MSIILPENPGKVLIDDQERVPTWTWTRRAADRSKERLTLTVNFSVLKLHEDKLRGAFRVTDSSLCRSETTRQVQMDSLTSSSPCVTCRLSWRQSALILRCLLYAPLWLLIGRRAPQTFILCFQMRVTARFPALCARCLHAVCHEVNKLWLSSCVHGFPLDCQTQWQENGPLKFDPWISDQVLIMKQI